MLTRKQLAVRNTHSIANDLKRKRKHSFTHANSEPHKWKIDMSFVQTITQRKNIILDNDTWFDLKSFS